MVLVTKDSAWETIRSPDPMDRISIDTLILVLWDSQAINEALVTSILIFMFISNNHIVISWLKPIILLKLSHVTIPCPRPGWDGYKKCKKTPMILVDIWLHFEINTRNAWIWLWFCARIVEGKKWYNHVLFFAQFKCTVNFKCSVVKCKFNFKNARDSKHEHRYWWQKNKNTSGVFTDGQFDPSEQFAFGS